MLILSAVPAMSEKPKLHKEDYYDDDNPQVLLPPNKPFIKLTSV